MKRQHVPFLFITACTYIVILLASVLLGRNAGLEPETEFRIPRYLTKHSFIQKVFDPYLSTEVYQGRELSHVFDVVDAYFIHWSAQHGFMHFFSLTHYVTISLLTMLTVCISIKFFHQKNLAIPYLLGIVFLTSPDILLWGFYFRTGKDLLSFTLILLCFLLFRYLTKKTHRNIQLVLLCITGLIATLFDRQGFFIISMLFPIFFIMSLYTKKIRYFKLAICFFITAIANIIYVYGVGPFLIHRIVGSWPDMSYLIVDYRLLFTSPAAIRNGITFFFDTLSFLFGNIGRIPTALLFMLFLYFLYASVVNHKTKVGALILLSVGSVILLDSIMILRHPPLLWPDVIRVYYPTPIYVLVILCANYVAAKYQSNGNRHSVIIVGFLLGICILNGISLPSHKAIQREGNISMFYNLTPRMIACINTPRVPIKNFTLTTADYPTSPADHERFCEVLRE